MNLKKRVGEILEGTAPGDRARQLFAIFITSLIVLNVLALVAGTVKSFREEYQAALDAFEVFSVIVFSVEYVLRLWSCTSLPRFHRPVSGRLRYAVTPLVLADLASVLPFYLPFTGLDLRFIRIVRVFRLLRLAKLARYSEALRTVINVGHRKKEELGVTLLVLSLLLVVASCLMYYVEHEAQPDQFSSIPASMWWAVATLTTVGYGDIYPVTVMGKILASVIAVLGIGMFGLPAGILGAGFVEEMQNKRRSPARCPHCGKEIPPGTGERLA
jgi:voltage-gated potassium channel